MYSRPLSPYERVAVAVNSMHQFDVTIIVEGHGKLSLDALQRAVTVAAEANPGVRVGLNGMLGSARWVDTGVAPRVRRAEAPLWNGRNDYGAGFLHQKLEPRKGEAVCDVSVVSANVTRVVFRCVHAVVDGRGHLHWMHDVFRVLRGERPVGASSKLQILDIMSKYQSSEAPLAPPVAIKTAVPLIISPGPDKGERLSYVWSSAQLGKATSNVLGKAAIALATIARHGEHIPISLTVPVDLRARQQVVSTGNLIKFISLTVLPDDTPRAVMQRLLTMVRNHEDCRMEPGLGVVPWLPLWFLEACIRFNFDRENYKPVKGATAASLGFVSALKLWDFSCDGFAASDIIGIPGFSGKLNVVMWQVDDELRAAMSAPARYNSEGQLDRLMEQFKKLLA